MNWVKSFMRSLIRLWLLIKDYYFWLFLMFLLFSLLLFKYLGYTSCFYLSCIKAWACFDWVTLLVSLIVLIIVTLISFFLRLWIVSVLTKVSNFYLSLLNYLYMHIKPMLVSIQVNHKDLLLRCWWLFIFISAISLCTVLETYYFEYNLDVYYSNVSNFLAKELFGCKTPKEVDDFYWWVSVFIFFVNVLIYAAALIYIYNDFKNKP